METIQIKWKMAVSLQKALSGLLPASTSVLKVHSNEDGQLDKTRTDTYLHFVNAKDNSVMEVDVVLRLIDANIESLDQLFKVLCLV